MGAFGFRFLGSGLLISTRTSVSPSVSRTKASLEMHFKSAFNLLMLRARWFGFTESDCKTMEFSCSVMTGLISLGGLIPSLNNDSSFRRGNTRNHFIECGSHGINIGCNRKFCQVLSILFQRGITFGQCKPGW